MILSVVDNSCRSHFHTDFPPAYSIMYMYKFLKHRRCLLLWIVFFFVLFLLSSKQCTVSFDGVVKGVKPITVWEFVMDFNNMKQLNPTILDFNILSDSYFGSEFDWQYQVKYTELLHQLPFIQNEAIANYKFKTVTENEFEILSNHKTCVLFNIYCVSSYSKFLFKHSEGTSSDTYCLEVVHYECPRIMTHFCYNEVIFQRKSIFENLEKLLSSK